MAEAFHGAFTALFVETPSFQGQSDKERRQLRNNLHLAEELGARISTVYGDDPAIQIAEYAKVSGISKIVLGRSPQKRGPLLGAKSLMDRLGELAPDLGYLHYPGPGPAARPPLLAALSSPGALLRPGSFQGPPDPGCLHRRGLSLPASGLFH